ncbi:hypothetical protein [Halococcus hamelinensis]|uniref:hypothetical protein n=1 Tax=Halococcus hamelinensis TaxID=332168 RepID=UPI001872E8B6|nr:hypothetical protein [Halococcus hamelinensis]
MLIAPSNHDLNPTVANAHFRTVQLVDADSLPAGDRRDRALGWVLFLGVDLGALGLVDCNEPPAFRASDIHCPWLWPIDNPSTTLLPDRAR